MPSYHKIVFLLLCLSFIFILLSQVQERLFSAGVSVCMTHFHRLPVWIQVEVSFISLHGFLVVAARGNALLHVIRHDGRLFVRENDIHVAELERGQDHGPLLGHLWGHLKKRKFTHAKHRPDGLLRPVPEVQEPKLAGGKPPFAEGRNPRKNSLTNQVIARV